jgi:cell fate regulator YaaT (PSP1 superfamily)
MQTTWLVRYGAIPEVAKFVAPESESLQRGAAVVVQSPRGLDLGTLLQVVPGAPASDEPSDLRIERAATSDDLATFESLRDDGQSLFAEWWSRIQDWKLELELVDVEWTLDRKNLVLYVLGGRSADTTKLALFAATAGHDAIIVQPVGKEGLVPMPQSQGGGCGCGEGGGCST